MNRKRTLALFLPLALVGAVGTRIPWEDLTESDWLYNLATRFAVVDGHRIHYPTPPAELAKLLEQRQESAALRQLAETRLSLGDRKGALAAMEKWAETEGRTSIPLGASAWAETARWEAAHQEMASAFKAAERAMPGLPEAAQRSLADDRIAWADHHPDLADPIAMRKARADLFPQDPQVLESWLRALEKAGRLEEMDQALARAKALSPERSLLLRSDLQADHGQHMKAFQTLDGALGDPWSMELRRAYTKRVDKAVPTQPARWRGILETRFDAPSLLRLATYFQGQGRGDAAAELLRQMERRHEASLSRQDHLLVARLYGEIDAIPEAFRAHLAAAHLGKGTEQQEDLATLCRLALRSGGRPLALGTYNDESYRWAASVDRTPGFWTGGIAFLLTGFDGKEALDRLESESLPDRTFAIARHLADELARRASTHPQLPGIRAALMERHVERGEGQEALALLPFLESAPPALADEGRRVALLAARQVEIPLREEARLMKARLRYLAPDGSQPSLERTQIYRETSTDGDPTWSLPSSDSTSKPHYKALLDDCLTRLESRDPSHLASLDLLLGEMDRMPAAEQLWLDLASRLEGWNLDDALGPRYEQALQRFEGPGIWARAARWYARRNYHADLKRLAGDIARTFRGASIFQRTEGAGDLRVQIPEQPASGGKVRLVLWADWVRLKALERFPHSPLVFKEAQRLMPRSVWQSQAARESDRHAPFSTLVPDSLMEERRWAVMFVDPTQREAFFAEAMKRGDLEEKLTALEAKKDRTPVEDQLLFEGWSRLSCFERASAPADRLAASYPGDGELIQRVLSLHRSLNGLDASHAQPAQTLVARSAQALEDPAPLWTELGELEEDRGHPEAAMTIWKQIVDREPRNPDRIAELATLLWDYGHDTEALTVVEEGRKRLGRPRFFAFETGVLRENLKDLDGAVREYLNASRPEASDRFISWFDRDQRSLRRLAQLLSKPKVYRIVESRIRTLQPGLKEDERTLAGLFPLGSIEPPDPGLAWDADTWIDEMDMPHDAVGRAQRLTQRAQDRPLEYDAIRRVGDLLLAKAQEMAPKATAGEFLDAVESWSGNLTETRWKKDRIIQFSNLLLARRAELAPSDEDRIRQETARATNLADHGRIQDADQVWTALDARIGSLPEGLTRVKTEVARALYLERAKGLPAASTAWQRLSERYPWNLGILEDHVAFLNRAAQGNEARALLESVLPKAASGHREALLARLAKESLEASDLPRAKRAVTGLLAEEELEAQTRLESLHLLARLTFRDNKAWNPYPTAKSQAAKLSPDQHAELYRQLALAADLESASNASVGLWIEALNRRTDRAWLEAACRSAARAGKSQELLIFFERQQQRSPRDVRWAVAVRDIRRALHQVDGAIAAAKAAVAARPEREELWQEAVDILIRADRIREAADYLEGWNRSRLADEQVASQRSELYARSGDGDRALAIEKAALAAYARTFSQNTEELERRKARATVRLMEAGLPAQALRIYSPSGDIRQVPPSGLDDQHQCELALLLGQFPRLLSLRSGNPDFLANAASVLATRGWPESREETLAFLLDQVLPPKAGRPQDAALSHWWPFATRSGLERPLRLTLAQRLVAHRPGPWQISAPLPFCERVGQMLAGSRSGQTVFQEPDLGRLWTQELAFQDRAPELLAFLEPRWQELLANIKGSAPLSSSSSRLPWASWLDDNTVLQVWSRAASTRPEKIRELGELMGNRRLWDRFWALAARRWQTPPLVSVLDQNGRAAWFRLWDTPNLDPVLTSRRHASESVTNALNRLIQGAPEAAKDPMILKLRGPRTVGEVLGNNSQWVWQEFAPRRDSKGQLAETGEDRIIGSGVDAGRLPGTLWGDRPGEAWYVLETLARYRQGDRSAPLVPLDVPTRSGETERILLALRMAKAMGDLSLALELEKTHPGSTRDRQRLEVGLSILLAANRSQEALERFRSYLWEIQATLDERDFRTFSALAETLGLPSPMELLDPDSPVGPAFLAYLGDQRQDVATSYHTSDPVGFRIALANRWRGRDKQLSATQIRFWMKELWVRDSAPLPTRGLAKLGGIWPHASDWLQRQPAQERSSALEALEGALQPGQPRLLSLLEDQEKDEGAQLLAVRIRLARGETGKALERVDKLINNLKNPENMDFPAYATQPPPSGNPNGEGQEEGDGSSDPSGPSSRDAMAIRLQAWLKPFRAAKLAAPVESRFRKLIQDMRTEGAIPISLWKLAFQIEPTPSLPALAQELDQAWFRGEIAPEQAGEVARVLADTLPGEAPRWLARWPRRNGLEQARERAAILNRLKQAPAASQTLVEARRRSLWSPQEEFQAFQAWRQLGPGTTPRTPASWTAALPFWKRLPNATPTALNARLKAHPCEAITAQSCLTSLAPIEVELMIRASLAIDREGDQPLLTLKAARGIQSRSALAARHLLRSLEPEPFLSLMTQRKLKTADIHAALGDLARIARRTGDENALRSILELLTERKAPGLKALNDELEQVRTDRPELYRLVDGKPAAIRPRDLSWTLLASILKTEGIR